MKELINEVFKEKEKKIIEICDRVWEYAETAFQEYKSLDLMCEALESEGFQCEKGYLGLATAFRAVYGTGRPHIGIIADYDALPGMSQQSGVCRQEKREGNENGHGCGHCNIAGAAFGAAVALKKYLEMIKKEGTVIVIGSPAEEAGSGKALLARDGAYRELDAAIYSHANMFNSIPSLPMVANVAMEFSFRGISAHAGASPHMGRNALSATELMNIGVNFMRENTISEARIHAAYVDAGGEAANIIQNYSKVRYIIRAPKIEQVKALAERVKKIAEGAALMTETKMEYGYIGGCSDYAQNKVLAQEIGKCYQETGAPAWDDRDYTLAGKFYASLSPELKRQAAEKLGRYYENPEDILKKPLHSDVILFDEKETGYNFSSCDIGDVAYLVPAVYLSFASLAIGNMVHTWQCTALANTFLGHKAMLNAGKVIALFGTRLIETPEIITRAKEEHSKTYVRPYQFPLE